MERRIPGQLLAEVTVRRPAGAVTTLGRFVRGITVLEAGSTTCPLYRGNVRPMRKLAETHPTVTFAVLYTREAHPGERRGPHRDIPDKLEAASELRTEAGEWRPILVDDVEGTLHRRLTGAPNSVLILDREARVLRWMHHADPRAVDRVLVALEKGEALGDQRAVFRPPPPHIALRALLRGGVKALWDFLLGLPALVRYRLSGGSPC